MNRTLVFLHGYGVRGDFWSGFAKLFGGDFDRVLTPDLAMVDLPTLIDTTSIFVRRQSDGSEASDGAYLVGHSLGAAVAAVVANNLGPEIVRGVVMMAPPYGEQHAPMKGLVRFLVRFRLIPSFLARARFYSDHTPVETQKEMFSHVVPENPHMQDAIFADKWFHTDILTSPLPQPGLVICSEADAVVASDASLALANETGARTFVYPRDRHVAHDDFVASPEISEETADLIRGFFLSA